MALVSISTSRVGLDSEILVSQFTQRPNGEYLLLYALWPIWGRLALHPYLEFVASALSQRAEASTQP